MIKFRILGGITLLFILAMVDVKCYAQQSSEAIKIETIQLNGVAVDIKYGINISKGDILVLPGWNFSRKCWCDSSTFCTKAISAGYRLIFPEMGKSIYASHYYQETRKDWRIYPTLLWLADSLIPYLQNSKGIFSKKRNYIIGLSTGARGVVLLCEQLPGFFNAGAALSGDYDQTTEPNDNLIRGVYGPFASFQQRWQTEDNPIFKLQNLRTPIYFGHAINDPIVPCVQTSYFFTQLNKKIPGNKCQLSIKQGGHYFKYWDSEVNQILNYFSKF